MHDRVGISNFITYSTGIDRKQNIQYFSHDITQLHSFTIIHDVFRNTFTNYTFFFHLFFNYLLVS